MNGFISFAATMPQLLARIVACDALHARWLNTLSYLENCGARKIAACEHPTLVKEEMLKHAAEEFRHAHHLKRQMARLTAPLLPTYTLPHILGGVATLHYLHALDLKCARYLLKQGLSKRAMQEAAYLLVTYAVEQRAAELYPLYDAALRHAGSPVAVKSILLEEKEHLREMEAGVEALSSGAVHAHVVAGIEADLCGRWLHVLSKQLQDISGLVVLDYRKCRPSGP
jgi:hypothetical protein